MIIQKEPCNYCEALFVCKLVVLLFYHSFNVDDNELYDGDFDLSWAVNYLVNIPVGELKAIDKELK